MSFLNAGGGPTIFIEVADESKKKLVRPLYDKPVCIWVHNIPTPETVATLPNGKTESVRLRDYSTEICTAVDKRGTGCGTCNRVDPAWNYLDGKSQTNKKGQRVDYPKRPVYLLPVWSYADNAIKVLRGGNQIYEEMDKWDSAGRNIRECDWMLWKQQLGKDRYQVKYHSQRMDSAAFSQNVTADQVSEAMKEAMREYAPSTMEALEKKLAFLPPEVAVQKYLESKSQGQGGHNALPPAQGFSQPQLPAAQGPFTGSPPPPAGVPATTGQLTVAGTTQDLTNPPAGVPVAVWAILTVDQKVAMLAATGGAAPSPLVQVAQPSPAAPALANGFRDLPPGTYVSTNPQTPVQTVGTPQATSTPVPATTSPAASPSVATATSPSKPFVAPANPADYVLESGKYAGQKLGDVNVKDPGYLKYLRPTQKPEIQALITAVIEAKPAMPQAQPTAPSAPPPTAPPVQTATGSAQPPIPAAAPAAGAGEREALVAECKTLISQVKDFQGRGMGDNMIPFLRRVSNGKFDYTEWDVATLIKLKGSLVEKLGGSPPADVQIAQKS